MRNGRYEERSTSKFKEWGAVVEERKRTRLGIGLNMRQGTVSSCLPLPNTTEDACMYRRQDSVNAELWPCRSAYGKAGCI